MALVGSEWVLYLLVILSILSIAVIIERWKFYSRSEQDLNTFRSDLRSAVGSSDWTRVNGLISDRKKKLSDSSDDFETPLCEALLQEKQKSGDLGIPILNELADDSLIRTRNRWEKSLPILATIASNAPFIGLFGTVLGIIQAFHDLSSQANTGVHTVTAGISEALVATAVGILVAIPAGAAFNLFQRKVRASVAEAQALKSFLIGQLSGK